MRGNRTGTETKCQLQIQLGGCGTTGDEGGRFMVLTGGTVAPDQPAPSRRTGSGPTRAALLADRVAAVSGPPVHFSPSSPRQRLSRTGSSSSDWDQDRTQNRTQRLKVRPCAGLGSRAASLQMSAGSAEMLL